MYILVNKSFFLPLDTGTDLNSEEGVNLPIYTNTALEMLLKSIYF